MTHISLFDGIGTALYAAELAGFQNLAASEINQFCRALQKQNFPHVQDIGDIETAYFGRYGGMVDVLSGGFPCQNISQLGNREGVDGAKSRLWRHYIRAIQETNCRFAIIENSPRLTSNGLCLILSALAEIGYNAEWDVFSAGMYGAAHIRERCYILAYPTTQRRTGLLCLNKIKCLQFAAAIREEKCNDLAPSCHPFLRLAQVHGEPPVWGDYDGLAARLHTAKRIGGIGNAMYWPILFTIFKTISWADTCTEREWLEANQSAIKYLAK